MDFCVIGLCCFGQTIAVSLEEKGHRVLAIDENEDNINKVSAVVTDAIIGNPLDEGVLASAGVKDYSCAVICFSDRIHDTIILSMMLKELGVKKIVARANSEIEYKVLKKLEIDEIVFPERDMGEKVALALDKTNALEYLKYSDDYSIVEIKVPSSWVGHDLIGLGLRKKFGINVISVTDSLSGKIDFSLSPERVFRDSDIITVIGSNKSIDKLGKIK